MSIMTVQSHSANHPNHRHKNSGTSGNSSSLNCTPLFKHMLMHGTLRRATTNTLTRPPGSNHETAMPATRTCVTHTMHHQTGKQSTSSNRSHGQGTGKLLNYRQLMNSPKYKTAWSLSAANKLGRLANGIGGHIKNPTNTIKFISQNKVLANCRNDVTYGQFVCLVRPKKAEPN